MPTYCLSNPSTEARTTGNVVARCFREEQKANTVFNAYQKSTHLLKTAASLCEQTLPYILSPTYHSSRSKCMRVYDEAAL